MKNKTFPSFQKGFTLIELLIVITIIGILAAALLPSVLSAPARARDAARIADLQKISTALETYNSDKGSYPTASGCIESIPGLTDYFPGGKPPMDPSKLNIGTCQTGGYFYCHLGTAHQSYLLASALERSESANGKPTDLDNLDCTNGTAQDPLPLNKPGSSEKGAYVVIQ